MSDDVRSEPLFLATLEVVSTKHPGTQTPLVGLVMAQRIAALTSRADVDAFIARVQSAADATWPPATARPRLQSVPLETEPEPAPRTTSG